MWFLVYFACFCQQSAGTARWTNKLLVVLCRCKSTFCHKRPGFLSFLHFVKFCNCQKRVADQFTGSHLWPHSALPLPGFGLQHCKATSFASPCKPPFWPDRALLGLENTKKDPLYPSRQSYIREDLMLRLGGPGLSPIHSLLLLASIRLLVLQIVQNF